VIQGLKVAVVVPAYRVERQIAAVLSAMPSEVDRIIVVDDASPDEVASVVSGLSDKRIRLIRNEENRGVGGAAVSGMTAAVEEGFDIIVKCDGDGQMAPSEIARLAAPLAAGEADHAKGSRFHHFRELGHMPKWRFLGNVGLTFLTKLASGYWNVLDPVNGFFATRAETLKRIALARLSARYFFETDLLIRLNVVEARVLDVPMPARYGGEPSSLSVATAVFSFPPKLFRGLARRIFWRYLFYDVSPVAVFAGLGALLFGFGLIFGGYQWIRHAVAGAATPLGTIMLATLPVILGFQLLLQAVVLDIQNTPKPGPRP
jgi:glycosyltransferase involved in cell wall biosynthesis